MKSLILALFMSSTAFAQVSQVEIKNFNFDYQAPLGEGMAEVFSYAQKSSQKVLVEKVGEDFIINLEGVENRELEFKNAPSLIRDAGQIHLSGFNLSYADQVSLVIAQGQFLSPEKSIDLKNLNLTCERNTTFATVMDQVITGCLQKMSFKANNFNSQGKGLDQTIIKAMDEAHDEFLGSVGVKNLELKVNGGKFELSAEIKAQISGKAKGNGTVKFDQDNKKITIKINEVKFGFLDVTSKVFDELEKQESAGLQVQKPYVYLTLK